MAALASQRDRSSQGSGREGVGTWRQRVNLVRLMQNRDSQIAAGVSSYCDGASDRAVTNRSPAATSGPLGACDPWGRRKSPILAHLGAGTKRMDLEITQIPNATRPPKVQIDL
jgi:hypothetical protein